MIACKILKREVEEVQQDTSFDTFQTFEQSLSFVLKNYLNKEHALNILNSQEKQMIFDRLCYILPVERALKCYVTDVQLNDINEGYHKIINEFRFKYEGDEIKLIDFNILAAFYNVVYHGVKSKKRTRHLKEEFAVPFLEGISLLKLVPKIYTACFSILTDCLNDVNNKNCSFEMLAKQNGSGVILRPVFNIKTDSRFTQVKELDQLLRMKKDKKQKLQCKTKVQDIFNFKNYNLNINTMQEANYEEFLSYIKQGEDTELTITNDTKEKLSLETYSMGKLLQVLILNTLGLVAAQLVKIYYSTRCKLKKIFSQNTQVGARSNLKERVI